MKVAVLGTWSAAVLLVVVLLVSRAGSSDGKTAGSSYANARAVHSAMIDAGLGCSPLDTTPAESADLGVPPQSKGTCVLNGDTVEIAVYSSTGQRSRAEAAAEALVCQIVDGFGGADQEFGWVGGGNWVVGGDKLATARTIEAALGGRVQAMNCP